MNEEIEEQKPAGLNFRLVLDSGLILMVIFMAGVLWNQKDETAILNAKQEMRLDRLETTPISPVVRLELDSLKARQANTDEQIKATIGSIDIRLNRIENLIMSRNKNDN